MVGGAFRPPTPPLIKWGRSAPTPPENWGRSAPRPPDPLQLHASTTAYYASTTAYYASKMYLFYRKFAGKYKKT